MDGELQERLYGEWDHSAVRGEVLRLLTTDESKRHELIVLDSNVLFNALISEHGCPTGFTRRGGKLDSIFKCALNRSTNWGARAGYPKFKHILGPHLVGPMLNYLQRAIVLDKVPAKHTALDPHDSYLLDLASSANAHYLVTGGKKAGTLELKRVGRARAILASRLCEIIVQR